MKIRKIALITFAIILSISACNRNKNQEVKEKQEDKPSLATYSFDADSAFHFVKAQTDFGPRVPNTEAHRLCAAYLSSTMSKYCDTVIVQPFIANTYDGKKLDSRNIIASFNPKNTNRILLGAHWDSRHTADQDPNPDNWNKPIDGANDGASGVGVLMELARQLSMDKPSIGIDIIFFDAEDYGTPSSVNIPGDWWCLGSQHWARNKHTPGYKAQYGILLDMVGAYNATFYHEGVSARYAPNILSKVWGIAYKLGYGNYFINSPANYITDDHYYINTIAKIPMINIVHQDKSTNTGFFPYWHTLQDNITQIDKNTLDAVGKTLMTVIYSEQ